ncbi:MAG: biopolymer transporter ExbD [Elusimicrobiota bacterium]
MKNRLILKTQINIIPVIDVSFVVVLILMIIAPFLNVSKVKMDLPKAQTSESKEEQQISVILNSNQELSVDEKRISWENLPKFLSQRLQIDPSSIVLIKVDRDLEYAKMEHLLDVVKESGANRIALATENKK